MEWNQVITIGRQFGSGGHEVGERVAKELGIPCYDRELIDMASQKLGVDQYDLEQVDEAALNRLVAQYQTAADRIRKPATSDGLTLNDSLYMVQCTIIEKLAAQGPCVIIGRSAGEVLKANPRLISIFIGASKEDRVKRISELYELSEREAADAIRRVDRKRRFYYENYTDRAWGSLESYHMMLNVSSLGMDRAVRIITEVYRNETKL